MPTLNWIGKEAVIGHHCRVPTRFLECDRELSVGDVDAENLLVEGDNLEALKALLPRYRGQVKCIYIDPPYNTGNEGWIYNDNVNDPRIRKWLGEVVGPEAEDLCRHDKWLCMLYPRLILLREFLRQDGVIFVSIDDTEVGHLRLLFDEVFGPANFLADVIWQKKYTRANDADYFSDNHDHILSYARHRPSFKIGRLTRTETQNKAYKNPDNHPLGPWKPTPLHAKSGTNTSPYTFKNGITWRPPQGTFRRFNDESMARLEANDEIWFGKKHGAVPQRKTFLGSLAAGTVPVTIWLHEVAGDNHIARDEVKAILAGTDVLFDSPKPVSLVEMILQLANDRSAIVLDSFAGSGTTGHAVLSMNQADGGNRRFILVEMDADICRNVTARRLERVVSGYGSIEGLGSGFRYFRLGRPLPDETAPSGTKRGAYASPGPRPGESLP
jgi:site-specific DNA-methyltransferase (adenine-specific)/adenine-specific DNA-methyltransferase